jgi:acyl dehydratase
MTTVLEEPADLLKLVGQQIGTTGWMKVTQQQVDQFAEATSDHQWIHTDQGARGERPAQEKTSGVESVFTLTYEIDSEDRPACVADVIVLYP